MKYLVLVWSGLARRKARTLFTMLSTVFAFLLFGLLQGINMGLDQVLDGLNADRLYVANKYQMTEGLPLAHQSRIATIEGVEAISHWTFFAGFYREASQSLPMFATNVPEMLSLFNEIDVSPAELEAMQQRRNGVMVPRSLAQRYGWNLGDSITLGSSAWLKVDGSTDYEFEIASIYDVKGQDSTGAARGIYINYDYFDESRQLDRGMVHYFIVAIADPRLGHSISHHIDALFANSTYETKSQTEQALAASQLNQLADIDFIVNAIVGAVLFTLFFLIANTNMQSLRERRPELATLKALGFSDGRVAALVLMEALSLTVAAAAIGLAAASYMFRFMAAQLGPLSMPISTLVLGFAIAVMLALASGFFPALTARRMSITQALARR